MIEIKNFTKSYKKDKKIINNLSLTVDDGCIWYYFTFSNYYFYKF